MQRGQNKDSYVNSIMFLAWNSHTLRIRLFLLYIISHEYYCSCTRYWKHLKIVITETLSGPRLVMCQDAPLSPTVQIDGAGVKTEFFSLAPCDFVLGGFIVLNFTRDKFSNRRTEGIFWRPNQVSENNTFLKLRLKYF